MQNVLISKLIPPNPSMNYIRRSRLLKKLSQSAHSKLTIVHSGAGFGKTSALAQLMADQKHDYSWYQVTEEDDDILPFLRHLFYSIQYVYPQFGKSMVGWDSFSMFPNLEELNKLAHLFINELCKVKNSMFVIIDDFHHVNHVFQINYILNKIVENLPPNIHFIIASRIYPNWHCILSLKLNGKLVECKEQDFIFSSEEVQVLFEDYFDRRLANDEIETILTVTEGWAIAISLLAIHSKDSSLNIKDIANISLHDFFAYLSEEVFENLSADERDALLKCSIFQSFTIELLNDFYDEKMALQVAELIKKLAFIQPLGGFQEFRFHALFQQFLEMKLQEGKENEYSMLHNKAANYFLIENNAVNAIYHSIKAKDSNLITDILVHFASYFIKAGQFDFLLERLKELSEENKESRYILYFYEGECQRFRAQYEKAKKAYEECLKLAEKENNQLAILKANAGIAHIYLDTIQPALAEQYLMEALKLAEIVELEKNEHDLLERQYAENLVNLGRAGEAEKRVTTKNLPEQILMQGNLDVRIYLRQGKLFEAHRLIRSRENKENVSIDAHRESDVLHALILTLMGENEEAFHCAAKSMRNSVKDHSQYAEAVAFLRKGHAMLLMNPLTLTEAEKCYLKTNDLMDEIHVTRAKAESYMGLALVKSRQGMIHEAISYGKQGLYETERVQDQWVSALLLTAFTMVYTENGNWHEAKQCAVKANGLYQMSPDYFGDMVTNFWLAYIAFQQNEKFEFTNKFQKFINICQEHHYYFFIQKQTLFGPKNLLIFLEMVNEWYRQDPTVEKDQIVKLVRLKIGTPIPKHTFTLQLFGPFTMMRDKDEIADKEWKREKAKELFLYFYINRNRFIAKEEIMNTLWPDSDEQSMNRDFKVAYNACLKVLEPNRSARDESAYIIRKQSMYQLFQTNAFLSDIDYFKRFADKGLEEKDPHLALEWLQKAVSLYKSDLLVDFPSVEWLTQIREELQRQLILVVERIAQNFMRLKEFQQTIFWCEKLIQLDVTWEEGYRLLMLAYYYQDKRPQAVKWYEKCVDVLEAELNIEPMESTIQMYEMMTR